MVDLKTMSPVTKANLLAFGRRDWSGARRAKDQGLGRWARTRGATQTFRLAQSLLDQVWDNLKKDPHRGTNVSGLVQLTGKLARARSANR
jgi:hypothetical protein